jgi:putative methanogenesis marker protein 8
MHPVRRLIQRYGHLPDLHITRIMGCLVAVSEGRAVAVERRGALDYCPLQAMLSDAEIEAYVEEKVREWGHFTARRELCRHSHGVPFGTSEMMMHALQAGLIDVAVCVCDGAGSVVSDRPEVVQGIGARMNGLFYTTAIPEVVAGLREQGALVFDDARIDQHRALLRALAAGYRRPAVTVNGYVGEPLAPLRAAAARDRAEPVLCALCTTGVDAARAAELAGEADLVWSCASAEVRRAGSRARLQLTKGIPVFVHSARGLAFLAAYADDGASAAALRELPERRQYLLAGGREGRSVRLGGRRLALQEARLPVGSENEPRPLR